MSDAASLCASLQFGDDVETNKRHWAGFLRAVREGTLGEAGFDLDMSDQPETADDVIDLAQELHGEDILSGQDDEFDWDELSVGACNGRLPRLVSRKRCFALRCEPLIALSSTVVVYVLYEC
jgi:hypothetical protein